MSWHVNSDEPIYLDYNVENKSVAQQSLNLGTPFRYSDHDPVVIGLNLGAGTTPPSIATGPLPQTVGEGVSISFSVTVGGTGPLAYQWIKDDVALSGATGPIFSIASTQYSDTGVYRVVVSNSTGSVTSGPAQLLVTQTYAAWITRWSLPADQTGPGGRS